MSIYKGEGVSGDLLFNDSYNITGGSWTDLILPEETAPFLFENEIYTFRIESETSFNTWVQNGNPYSDGTCSSNDDGLQTDYDMNFKTYLIPVANIEAGTDQVICEGGEISLSASGGTVYNWNNDVEDNQSFVPEVGNNQYIVIGENVDQCIGTDTINILVNENPELLISGNLEICIGDSAKLSISGADTYN